MGGRLSAADLRERLKEAVALRWSGRIEEAKALFAEVARVAEEADEHAVLADALQWLAIVRSLPPASVAELEEALSLQERGLEIDVELHGERHPRVAEGLRLVGSTLVSLERFDVAFDTLTRARDAFRSLGKIHAAYEDVLFHLQLCLQHRQAFAEAIDVLRERIEVCEALSDPRKLCYTQIQMGEMLIEMGRATEALRHLATARELAEPRIRAGRAKRLDAAIDSLVLRARALEPQITRDRA